MNRLVHILYRIDSRKCTKRGLILYIMISPPIGEHPKDIMVGPPAGGIRGKPHKVTECRTLGGLWGEYMYKMYQISKLVHILYVIVAKTRTKSRNEASLTGRRQRVYMMQAGRCHGEQPLSAAAEATIQK